MDPNNPPVIPDASIGGDQSFNNSVTSSGYPDNSVAQHQPQPVDIAALIAANQELTNQLNQMNLGYNTHVKAEMDAFRAAVRDDFFAVQAQRDAAQAEVAATIARLELLEGYVTVLLNCLCSLIYVLSVQPNVLATPVCGPHNLSLHRPQLLLPRLVLGMLSRLPRLLR
jgi:hypothetical protein